MKEYDAIVVGSGCGMLIVDDALAHDMKVALVDKGPLGGTCLNLGCIPSKMLIYPADRLVDTQEAKKLGIEAEIKAIDFRFIMQRMRKSMKEDQTHIRQSIKYLENLDFYEGEGHFVGDYTMEVNGEQIRGKNIFLASGSRPLIPPIKGIDSIDYLTNETLLQLNESPASLIIIGGGYIGVEYGHFFAAMGTKVTILEMANRLVLSEEPEISRLLKKELSKRMEIYTDTQVEELRGDGNGVTVLARDTKNGQRREFTAEKILVAVGRSPNADLLKVENTGVALDTKGFIRVNEYFETTRPNIFAVGDANGLQMFTHAANREATLASYNVLHGAKMTMDYHSVPHAVYSHPQIASVGLTEEQARKSHDILVGRAKYMNTARGEAMLEKEGFAKAIVDRTSGNILGFHIVGPQAPELIQEVVNAMASGGHINEISDGLHIHPALAELIPRTLNSLVEP